MPRRHERAQRHLEAAAFLVPRLPGEPQRRARTIRPVRPLIRLPPTSPRRETPDLLPFRTKVHVRVAIERGLQSRIGDAESATDPAAAPHAADRTARTDSVRRRRPTTHPSTRQARCSSAAAATPCATAPSASRETSASRARSTSSGTMPGARASSSAQRGDHGLPHDSRPHRPHALTHAEHGHGAQTGHQAGAEGGARDRKCECRMNITASGQRRADAAARARASEINQPWIREHADGVDRAGSARARRGRTHPSADAARERPRSARSR